MGQLVFRDSEHARMVVHVADQMEQIRKHMRLVYGDDYPRKMDETKQPIREVMQRDGIDCPLKAAHKILAGIHPRSPFTVFRVISAAVEMIEQNQADQENSAPISARVEG